MKRILLFTALGALFMAVPGFTDDPPPGHKVFWCHYPPGQTPDKVILIVMDENAIDAHLGHPNDHATPTPDVNSCGSGQGGGG